MHNRAAAAADADRDLASGSTASPSLARIEATVGMHILGLNNNNKNNNNNNNNFDDDDNGHTNNTDPELNEYMADPSTRAVLATNAALISSAIENKAVTNMIELARKEALKEKEKKKSMDHDGNNSDDDDDAEWRD